LKTLSRLFISFIILITISSGHQAEARYAAIVIDAESGAVLHSVNADTRNYPASLTKMMTLYMLFEALDQGNIRLHQKMIVSRNATRARPSKLGLRPGERITVQDAIEALIAKSANDIAVVVAEKLGGSVRAFAKTMTKRARKLGMGRTTFRNPHGLPNRNHLSTARDMAVLSRLLITGFPQYYNYFAIKNFKFRGRNYKNHNKLLRHYIGADGIKTGYTKAAGYNLAASAEREGNRIIAVVFGGKTAKLRDLHVKNLLDKGFAKLSIEQGSRDDTVKDLVVEKVVSSKSRKTLATPPSIKANSLTVIPFENATTEPTSDTIFKKENRKTNRRLNLKTPFPLFRDGWPKDFAQTLQPPQTSPLAQGKRKTDVAELTAQAQANSRTPRTWMIQMGAYFQMASAVTQAIRAAENLSALGKDYEVTIMIGKSNERTVYRSRLSGLSKKDAIEACRQLKKYRFDCITMPPYIRGAKNL
jgi:D-alanyl-D-alanine carboxypeptidase